MEIGWPKKRFFGQAIAISLTKRLMTLNITFDLSLYQVLYLIIQHTQGCT